MKLSTKSPAANKPEKLAFETTVASPFEKLYLKERKKSHLLLATTIVALALAGGSLSYGLKKSHTPAPRAQGPFGQNFGGNGGPGMGGLRGLSVKSLIKSDGTVDTDRIKQLIDNVPSEFKDRLLGRVQQQIADAKAKGDITDKQAQDLQSALGVTGTSGSTNAD